METVVDKKRGLISAKDSSANLAAEAPHPRGWPAFGSDLRRIGQVDDLVVDSSTQQVVRFLNIQVDDKEVGLADTDRHAFVQAGRARLDFVRNILWVP